MSPDYQIHELAEKAGVSIRTIRFYIDEGLLPAPQVRGRYSVYSDEYLARLELIRLLKDRYLPLREIRVLLQSTSDENIQQLLGEERAQAASQGLPPLPGIPATEPAINNSALEYVNRVLKRPPTTSYPKEPAENKYYLAEPKLNMQPSSPESLPDDAESWSLIRLAPGIELHIQQPVEKSSRQKLYQLIQFARKLFNW
jgi:DNA-binding transcriptional MerR regulator